MSLSRPVGVAYPNWVRQNIVLSDLSHEETAKKLNVSLCTVRRARKRWQSHGDLHAGRFQVHPSLRRSTLSANDCQILAQFVCMYPQVTLVQLQQFLFIGLKVALSTATICRELKKLGFSRKQINRFSIYRRESDRISWWLNPPSLNGCNGVDVDDIVDVDESKFTWESAERRFGYSFKGMRAKTSGMVSAWCSHFILVLFDESSAANVRKSVESHSRYFSAEWCGGILDFRRHHQ